MQDLACQSGWYVTCETGGTMKFNLINTLRKKTGFPHRQGAIGWVLLWAIGIPIPLLLIFFLIRGCT
jgi:hypothetical protein